MHWKALKNVLENHDPKSANLRTIFMKTLDGHMDQSFPVSRSGAHLIKFLYTMGELMLNLVLSKTLFVE
jgi:hypothetical protein